MHKSQCPCFFHTFIIQLPYLPVALSLHLVITSSIVEQRFWRSWTCNSFLPIAPCSEMLISFNIDLDTLLLRWFGRIQSCTDSRAALQDGTILISLRSALHPDLPEKSGSQSQNAELNGSSLFLIHSSCLLMILQRWIWWTYPVTICPRMIRAESFTSGYVIRSYTEGSVSQPLQSRWSM